MVRLAPDFIIRHDSSKEPDEALGQKIILSLMLKRTRAKKPTVVCVSGKSAEGKSMFVLGCQDLLLNAQGIDMLPYVNDVNVYHPLQYPPKKKALLFDKKFKKVNVVALHEGRLIIKASHWQSFQAQAVADINATSRSIKPFMTFIVSQTINDITKQVRRTMNYYVEVTRANYRGAKAHAKIYALYTNDRDLENPRTHKRKIFGYVFDEKGKCRVWWPSYIEFNMPRPELVEIFEKGDTEAKRDIIDKMLGRLMNEMEKDIGYSDKSKVEKTVEWYLNHPDQILNIGKRMKNGFRLNKSFSEMHNFDKEQKKQFEKLFFQGLEKSEVTQSEREE